MDGTAVSISVADAAERPLIEGLFQLYVYDFSELEPADSPDFEVGPDGRFGPSPYIGDYWTEPSRTPIIIRRGVRTVGFALLNGVGHSGLPVDRNMAEFFVMRKHRRAGVASAAVRALLTGYTGLWEIAVAERNSGARAFWPGAVAATPGVRGLETLQGDGVRWRGPILRFIVDA